MTDFDTEALLAMLRDPNCETQEIAAAAGIPRDEVGRACRIVMGIAKAKPEDVLTLPAPLALAVLRAATSAGRSDVVAAATGHANKDVVKEAKRTLYLLKTRGVAVPEPPRAAPPAAPAPAEQVLPCYASTLDGHGERAVWIGRTIPGKGIEVAQAVISDLKGLTELHLGVLGRKEYRAFGKDLLERGHAMGVAEIDREVAKSLVAAARKLNGEGGEPPPAGTDAWLARLGPAADPPDLAARFSPLPDEEERAALESSGRLHELPLVRSWLADEDALRALAQKLDEIAVSSLYLDERQRQEGATLAIQDALTAHFQEARRALWSSRLFALADHLERGGDPGSARLAAAAARALRSGVAAAMIPFARLLIEKAFPPPSAPTPPTPDASSSLLVQPPR
jgi:hypothetical protein